MKIIAVAENKMLSNVNATLAYRHTREVSLLLCASLEPEDYGLQAMPEFRIANCLQTNHEYPDFMEDGGYLSPGLWLADGWLWKEATNASHPHYWIHQDGDWFGYILYGFCQPPLSE